MPTKRVVLATFGSLGDLHPYVALALELRRRGQRPVIATIDHYAGAIESLGLEFAPMRPLEAQLGRIEDHIARVFDPLRGTEYMVRRLILPHVREAYQDLLQAARDADVLVTHPLAMAGPLVAEKSRIAWASSVLSPLNLFSETDMPVYAGAPYLAWARRLGVGPYRALFALLKRLVRHWEKPLAALREEIGLPPAPPALFEGQYSPRLNLALFSREIAAPQADWPPNTVVCGFARHEGPDADAAMRARLEAFFDAGEAPVVFTLGSSAYFVAGRFWDQAMQAARRLKRRALLVTGSGTDLRPASAAFASLPWAPYSRVFPRAAAVVHQGGIGTLAQALAAGTPQLVVPVAFDQPDNARRAQRLGVARSVPFRKADAARMSEALRDLLSDRRYAERAHAVAQRIAAEDGAARAADALLAIE